MAESLKAEPDPMLTPAAPTDAADHPSLEEEPSQIG
jgi:hypothetical protein